MQYNIHNEKYKITDIGGIHAEQFREYKDASKYKNEVHDELTHLNETIILTPGGEDWKTRIKEARSKHEELTGKKLRKDAVVICSTIESVPASWPTETCKEYFKDKSAWYGQYLEKMSGLDHGSMLSCCIHLDETSPHATIAFMPLKDKKFNAKEIISKNYLKALQTDSQTYTMNWIETYCQTHHMELERLEPIIEGNQKQHMAEHKFKAMKMKEETSALERTIIERQLQKMQADAAVSAARKKLEETRNAIGTLENRSAELKEKTAQAVEAKASYERATAAAAKQKEQYEEKFISLTEAPSIAKYEELKEANVNLKKEISLKDRVISTLQEEVQIWKGKWDELSAVVSKIAHEVGSRIIQATGVRILKNDNLSEYPSKSVIKEIKVIRKEVEHLGPNSLRVVPGEDGYMVVHKTTSGKYEPVHTGFEDRAAAEEYRRNYSDTARMLQEKIHPEEKLGQKLN